MRVATEVDGPILELTAGALADHEQNAAIVARDGASYDAMTASGTTLKRQRPEVKLATEAWRRALLGLTQLGLTPATRGKVEARPGADPGDVVDRFRRQRHKPGPWAGRLS
jgi:hypothetical protein